MQLSILCATKAEPYSEPFLAALVQLKARLVAAGISTEVVLLADGAMAQARLARWRLADAQVDVQSRGYLESVLEMGVAVCRGDYILRVDDDERVSESLALWLLDGAWRNADHWKFARRHLWGDANTWLITPHLWPDWQTRLSVKAKSGGRHAVHAGSPFGGGEEAPLTCCLDHHKFLVKTTEERLTIAQQYDRFHEGYGTGSMLPFSLPERAYAGQDVTLQDLTTGARRQVRLDPRGRLAATLEDAC